MATPQVSINGVHYYVEPRRGGHHVDITATEQFIEAQSLVGGQTQEALKGRSTRTFGPWTSGHGFNRIPEKEDGNPVFFKGFWDSDGVQTWFEGDARLPILEEASTPSDARYIVASTHFGGDFWTLWSQHNDDATTSNILSLKYVGSTDTYTTGGTVDTENAATDGIRAFDMVGIGGFHLALINIYDLNGFYRLQRSTNGASWSDGADIGSANDLTQATRQGNTYPINGGLIAPRAVAGEVVIATWDENNSQIDLWSTSATSTPGSSITTEISISSGGGPAGIAVMQGIDNADKVYLGTEEGLYEIDTSPATWTATLIDPLSGHADNCRRMLVHNGALWYPTGADDDTPAGIKRLVTADRVHDIQSGWGLAFRDGVESDALGTVQYMESVGEYLFISVGGGKASRNARIFLHNGEGWHTVRKHGTANVEFNWIGYSGEDNAKPRLHYSIHSSTEDDTKFLAHVLTNPQSGVSIKREASGTLVLPEFDGGMATTPAAFLQQRINAADLTTTSGEYVNANYGVDGAVRTTDLENFVSATKTLKHASGAGVSGTSYGVGLDFHRDGGTNTDTPKVRSLEVVYRKMPTELITANFTIDVAKQMNGGLLVPAKEVRKDLEAARDLSTLVAFDYADLGTKYVKVRLLRSQEKLVQHSGGGEGATNTFWIRNGLIDVECEEIAG